MNIQVMNIQSATKYPIQKKPIRKIQELQLNAHPVFVKQNSNRYNIIILTDKIFLQDQVDENIMNHQPKRKKKNHS